MASAVIGPGVQLSHRWLELGLLLIVLAYPRAMHGQSSIPDAASSHAQTAGCDASHTLCSATCMSTPECDACEKAWLDCKGGIKADIKEIIDSLPTPPAVPVPPLPPSGGQNDKAHIIDGCSVPGILGGQDPAGGVVGEGSTEFGRPQGSDDGNVMGKGDKVLDLPCNKHDICYQTCGKEKAACDQKMYDDMVAVCDNAYPGNKCPRITQCIDWYAEKAKCALAARMYKSGLDRFGSAAYQERQAQFCKIKPHIIDGCSVPGILGGQDPAGGVLGKSGPGGTRFGRPQEEGNANVVRNKGDVEHLPCNDHDVCYQTCGADKAACDEKMYQAMNAVCEREYPGPGCPQLSDPSNCKESKIVCASLCGDWYEERARCASAALKYKLGLDLFGGKAFRERQELYCESGSGGGSW